IHASSSGGGDAPTLLNDINNAVNQMGQYRWFALGDYNREPQGGGLPFSGCPSNAPTYPATDPKKYYDYMMNGSGMQLSGVVKDIQLSDHLPVQFTFSPS